MESQDFCQCPGCFGFDIRRNSVPNIRAGSSISSNIWYKRRIGRSSSCRIVYARGLPRSTELVREHLSPVDHSAILTCLNPKVRCNFEFKRLTYGSRPWSWSRPADRVSFWTSLISYPRGYGDVTNNCMNSKWDTSHCGSGTWMIQRDSSRCIPVLCPCSTCLLHAENCMVRTWPELQFLWQQAALELSKKKRHFYSSCLFLIHTQALWFDYALDPKLLEVYLMIICKRTRKRATKLKEGT